MTRILRFTLLMPVYFLQTALVSSQALENAAVDNSLISSCFSIQISCDDDSGSGVIFGQSQMQSTLRHSRTISGQVGNRLAPGGGTPAGGASQYAPATESFDPAAQALEAESTSLATNDPAMNWSAWFDSSFVYTDRNHPASGYDGPMYTASLGIDRAIGEASVIGILVNTEHVDFDTSFGPGTLKSHGYGIGIYAGSAITQNIVADAMLIVSQAENDSTEFGFSGSFDSHRLQAAANLTGYWYRDAWRYSPTVGLAWSRDNQDSYFNGFVTTPSRTLDSAVAIAGFQLGHTNFIDDVRTIEPWIGVNAEWEFHTSGLSTGVGGAELDPFDIRLQGGLNAQMSQSVSASVKADIAGLARSDYFVGTFGGQVAVRF